MIKDDRLHAIKEQALKSLRTKAANPNNGGVSMIAVTPHEALKLVDAYIKVGGDEDNQQAVP